MVFPRQIWFWNDIYSADENPLKWIHKELQSDEEKQSSFINFPCDVDENPTSWVSH